MLDAREVGNDLLAFIQASPSPYHAVLETTRRLAEHGFRALDEREAWTLAPGDKAFVVRGGGTVVAFVMGTSPPEEAGFLIVGGHTDSPNFRVKPRADLSAYGFRQLGVETYGSMLLHTWTDRDLGIAGRVTLEGGDTRLLRIDRAVCRIPNLAIHLNPQIASGLTLNPQQHMVPVIGLEAGTRSELKALIAAELSGANHPVSAESVLSYDLCLFDLQPGAFAGASDEFVCSARLDNLASCHAAVRALLASSGSSAATRVIALMDHEEVGSQSAAGAQSRFLFGVLERLARVGSGSAQPDAVHRALARSLCISSDMAHAQHPNYADRHEPQHAPRIGQGPVIKINSNQSYATDAPGAALFERACREAGFSAQHFVSRNDMRCGSTIGPISAARLGVRTVDVGNPMLGMHSCREMAGTADAAKLVAALGIVLSAAAVPPPSV